MVRTSGLLALLATATSAVIAEDTAAIPQALPGAYIIEFADGHDSVAAKNAVVDDASTRVDLDYELFKGVSIQLNDVNSAEEKAQKLAQLPEVKNIWPVMMVPAPNPRVEWIGSEGLDAISKIPHGAINSRASQDYISSAQRMGQIEKLRAKGISGRGIKIGVVDTGIDYTHPALGGCFGEGCLVSYGYNLVGDHYGTAGDTNPKPNNDPIDCSGHGSHVAGIIAAAPNAYNFSGVAPEVTLGAYRVFGCIEGGLTSTDVLISAFNKAYQAGSDIITASIGGPSGWMDEPWAQSIQRIVDRGVPCTVAVGNDGKNGLFYQSSGSSAPGAIGVASFDNTETPSLYNLNSYTVDGGDKKQLLVYPSSPDAWDGVSREVWAPSFDTNKTDDGCSPFPADTPDLKDKIVLIQRGTCTFSTKLNNAADKGATRVIVYNNQLGDLKMDTTAAPRVKAAAMIDHKSGAAIIDLLKAGKKVEAQLDTTQKSGKVLSTVANTKTPGAASDYTNYGPTWELNVKPEVAAPGGNILSTFPVSKGSWAVLSGTSMATPFVAGSVALLLQVRGKNTSPATLKNLLSAYSKAQLFNDNTKFYNGTLAPVPQQGSGEIQVYDAAYATTLLEPANLSFNDTAHLAKKLTFKLSNTGKESVTFNIGQVSALTMYALSEGSTHVKPFPNDIVDTSAKLSFSQDKVTIGAGSSASVDVSVTPPPGLDPKRLGVWSGYVTLNGTDGTNLSLPYQGVTGSMKDSVVLAKDDSWVANSDDKKLSPVAANTTFILPGPGNAKYGDRLPLFVINLSLGSKNVTGHLQPMTTCPPNSTYEYKGYKTIGQPFDFPALFQSREASTNAWDGQLANGDYAPPGKYRLIARALRIFGDPDNDNDWDVSVGPGFKIQYK